MMGRRLARRLLETGERAGAEAGTSPGTAWPDDGLGLSDERLLGLAAEYHFGTVAGCFRRAGGPLELRQVAWWGSALADIACAAAARRRDDDLLADAALFHLAVALFDQIVDDQPDRSGTLAESVDPSRLRLKLESPSAPDARLHCNDPELDLIVGLFDGALGGIGRRLEDEPAWRDEILQMLEAMYVSELALSDDPMVAKTLPFTLVGHLALRPGEAAPRALFQNLAHLLGLWDDWQDLLADGWALAPNAHLGPRDPRGTLPRRLRGLARGLWLTLMGAIPRHEISGCLSGALEATLESARPLPGAARQKTVALLLHMLGAFGSPATPGRARRSSSCCQFRTTLRNGTAARPRLDLRTRRRRPSGLTSYGIPDTFR